MRNYGSDPVSAISEAEATGEVAAIFADIRETMQLPMLTSIWRTLVAIPGGLPAAWKATKPLYQTGQPESFLVQYRADAQLPLPAPILPGQLERVDVLLHDLPAIRNVVAAYNRSNGLNLIALTGLISEPVGALPEHAVPPPLPPWSDLPPLLTEADMTPATWQLLQQVNRFGAGDVDAGLATLWRHLAHWPGLLELIHTCYLPLEQSGTVNRSIRQTLQFVESAAARLAHLRRQPLELSDPAREMIESYVREPSKVARMVTIGHALERWLCSAAAAQ